jgi:nicotinamide mononucleotide transporter
MTSIEAIGATLALVYLILAMRESSLCWLAAIVSSILYLQIFLEVHLYTEAALQVFYIILAVKGYHSWHVSRKAHEGLSESEPKKITTMSKNQHLVFIAFSISGSLLVGYFFSRYTDAALPYIDALITCFSVSTTYLVTEKILENWVYWIVIDAVAVILYLSKDLYITAFLFSLYVVLALRGYQMWKAKVIFDSGKT